MALWVRSDSAMTGRAEERVANRPRDPVTGIRKHPFKLRCGIGNCLRFVPSFLRPVSGSSRSS